MQGFSDTEAGKSWSATINTVLPRPPHSEEEDEQWVGLRVYASYQCDQSVASAMLDTIRLIIRNKLRQAR